MYLLAGTRGSLYFPDVESISAPVGVDIGHLGLQAESFTISVWVRVAAGAMTAWDGGDKRYHLSILGTAQDLRECSTRGCLFIRFQDDQMTFGFFDDALSAAGDTPYSASSEEEQWHHWSFTFNAINSQRCVMRDGGAAVCDTAGGSLVGDPLMQIGGHFTNIEQQSFMGHMANFAVWRETLSSEMLEAYSTCQWETTVVTQADLVFFSNIQHESSL